MTLGLGLGLQLVGAGKPKKIPKLHEIAKSEVFILIFYEISKIYDDYKNFTKYLFYEVFQCFIKF